MNEKEPEDYPLCKMRNCVNYDKGCCTKKNPEKRDDVCLHFEDIISYFRLRTDPLKGTLKRG